MKKFITVLLLVFLIGTKVEVSANMPVIDTTNILAFLSSILVVIDNLEATIQTVENNWNKLQNTYKQFEAFDFGELWQGDNFRDRFRNSLNYTMGYVNKMNNVQRRLESMINTRNMEIAGVNFSLGDLVMNPAETIGSVGIATTRMVAVDPWQMSDNDKMRFWSQYGLDPGTYRRLNAAKDFLHESTFNAIVMAAARTEQREADEEEIVDLMVAGMTEESEMMRKQVEVSMNVEQINALRNATRGLTANNEMLGWWRIEMNKRQEALDSVRIGNQLYLDTRLQRRLGRITEAFNDLNNLVEWEDEVLRSIHINKDAERRLQQAEMYAKSLARTRYNQRM